MEQGFEFGAAVILFIASIVIYVALTAIYIISEWMIFKKAGEKSWKALIPFYSVFVSHHIVGMSHVWFIIEVITWIAELVFEILESVPKPVDFWFGLFTLAFTLVSGVVHAIKLCNCFGKGTRFKVGLILIPEIFMLILAFGKAQFTKPEHKSHAKRKDAETPAEQTAADQ